MRSSAVDAVSSERTRWVDIAAERGYSDQAHLVREFRQILGLTPTAFDAHIGRIRHGRIVR
jgi:AraC-like DNA-binding protein